MTAGVVGMGPGGAFLMNTMTFASSPAGPTTTSSSFASAPFGCCDWQYGSALIWMTAGFGAVPSSFTVPLTVAASALTAAGAAAAVDAGAAVPAVLLAAAVVPA